MSKIEWTEKTWNPIVGCSIVSPGCTNCYAMRQAARIEKMNPDLAHYRGLTQPSKAGPVWIGKVALSERALLEPLRRRKPTTWFVNSMGDLFHEDAPDAWIDRVFTVMALSPQHTFQVLTKRAKRMREYCELLDNEPVRDTVRRIVAAWPNNAPVPVAGIKFPLPNVWLGVSADDQKRADERIPDLLATPAAVRFVSAEPLLGPINFGRWLPRDGGAIYDGAGGQMDYIEPTDGLDWIIVGGESGPSARPMLVAWARSIRDQCKSAGVPFFFKQFGEFAPDDNSPGAHTAMKRIGKHHAGRLLDGRTHDDMPDRLPCNAKKPRRPEPAGQVHREGA